MKNKTLTTYLTVFLLVCIVLDGILLCCCASKPWWNNRMIMPPNLFMILGAFYCHFMIKNVKADPHSHTWMLVYKGIKIVLTVAAMVLYLGLVKKNGKAFIIVTAVAYLVGLAVETAVYVHFMHKQDRDKK